MNYRQIRSRFSGFLPWLMIAGSITIPYSPPGFAGPCFRDRILSLFASKAPGGLQLNEADRAIFKEWSERYQVSSLLPLTPPQTLLAFTELPPNIREAIFTDQGRRLTEKEVRARVRELGISRGPVERVINEYGHSQISAKDQDPYLAMEASIAREIPAAPAARAQMKAEIDKRMTIAKGVDRLSDTSNPEYRLVIEGDLIHLPDGGELTIREKRPDGTLLVSVDQSHVIRTQDYFNFEHFNRHLKDKNLGKEGFIADLTPNGMFRIMDGHHRVSAYASTHDGQVLFRISPHRDGSYYSLPHFMILNFSGKWGNLPDEVKLKIAREAAVSPIQAIRDLYYGRVKLSR